MIFLDFLVLFVVSLLICLFVFFVKEVGTQRTQSKEKRPQRRGKEKAKGLRTTKRPNPHLNTEMTDFHKEKDKDVAGKDETVSQW